MGCGASRDKNGSAVVSASAIDGLTYNPSAQASSGRLMSSVPNENDSNRGSGRGVNSYQNDNGNDGSPNKGSGRANRPSLVKVPSITLGEDNEVIDSSRNPNAPNVKSPSNREVDVDSDQNSEIPSISFGGLDSAERSDDRKNDTAPTVSVDTDANVSGTADGNGSSSDTASFNAFSTSDSKNESHSASHGASSNERGSEPVDLSQPLISEVPDSIKLEKSSSGSGLRLDLSGSVKSMDGMGLTPPNGGLLTVGSNDEEDLSAVGPQRLGARKKDPDAIPGGSSEGDNGGSGSSDDGDDGDDEGGEEGDSFGDLPGLPNLKKKPDTTGGPRRATALGVAKKLDEFSQLKSELQKTKVITRASGQKVRGPNSGIRSLPVSPPGSPRRKARMLSRRASMPTTFTQTSTASVRYSDSDMTGVNQFTILKGLGQGAYGEVKLARSSKDNQLYAIKCIHRSKLKVRRLGRRGSVSTQPSPLENVKQEIAIMKKLRHDNCVQLVEVIDDLKCDCMFLVLEYVDGGPVMTGSEGQPMSEETCHRYFRDLCRGLLYLHENKIIHQDIKPENLLVSKSDNTLKISDYGISRVLEGNQRVLNKTEGTPAFIPPEACIGTPFEGEPMDVWAAGICLYMFVYGHTPFRAPTFPAIVKKIRKYPIPYPDEGTFDTDSDDSSGSEAEDRRRRRRERPIPQPSSELKSLLKKVLEKDPKQRITVREMMEHEWVTKGGLEPLASSVDKVEVTEDDVRKAINVNAFLALANLKKKIIAISARARRRASMRSQSSVPLTPTGLSSPLRSSLAGPSLEMAGAKPSVFGMSELQLGASALSEAVHAAMAASDGEVEGGAGGHSARQAADSDGNAGTASENDADDRSGRSRRHRPLSGQNRQSHRAAAGHGEATEKHSRDGVPQSSGSGSVERADRIETSSPGGSADPGTNENSSPGGGNSDADPGDEAAATGDDDVGKGELLLPDGDLPMRGSSGSDFVQMSAS
eukprot:Rmarinus@m.15529